MPADTGSAGAAEAAAFRPIDRRKVYELVSDRLAARITTSLEPGDQLPSERELSEAFGVGRSSVREALRMLQSRGLIESQGNGTLIVAPRTNPFRQPLTHVVRDEAVDRRQLFEVRRMIEAEAAALAAERRTVDSIELMRIATRQMEEELVSPDGYIAADIRFHLAVAEATGNRLMPHLMEAIRERLREMFGSAYLFPGGPQRSITQHLAITEAIEAQDATRARALMIEHIERVEHELEQLDD